MENYLHSKSNARDNTYC